MEISSVRPPKESRATLDAVNGTFIVQNGLVYDYYPVKVSELIPGMFLKLDVSPPLLKEGTLVFQKKFYRVSVQQLLKRKIHVRSQYFPASNNTNNNETSSERQVQSRNERGAESTAWAEELEAANMALEGQIESLRALDDPQAEWITPLSSQSRSGNEGSAVQDTQDNS